MRSKLFGCVVLAAAILAVIFLIEPWKKEASSDQFVVHRREKRDLNLSDSATNTFKNGTTKCTPGVNCSQMYFKTLDEARRFCHQNISVELKFNCSGRVLSFSEYCVKINGISSNDSEFLNCLKLAGSEHQVNTTSIVNNSSPVVVQLLVSPSKVLSVSLETSANVLNTTSSIILQVLPNMTVAVVQEGTRSKNTTALGTSAVKDHKPSTVHVNLPVSSKVKVNVVPTTEKDVPTTEKVEPTTDEMESVTEVVQTTSQESTTVKTETTQPSTIANKPSTQQKTDITEPAKSTGNTDKTTVKTTIHIIKNTVKSPYAEEEQSMRFFMSNVMMPISCGVGAAIIIALAYFMYRRFKRRKLKRVRYFGSKPGEKQFLDRMKLLEDSSEEE